VVDVRRDEPRFQAAGGQVLLVTMGTAEEADRFRRELEAPCDLLADAQQVAYRAYRLPRGTLWQVAGPAVWGPAVKALFRGGSGKAVGDIWQMPGAFVVDRQGKIRFAHYPANQADRVSHEAMIETLKEIAGG